MAEKGHINDIPVTNIETPGVRMMQPGTGETSQTPAAIPVVENPQVQATMIQVSLEQLKALVAEAVKAVLPVVEPAQMAEKGSVGAFRWPNE